MDNIVVADKSTSELTARAWGDLQLPQPGVVQMPVAPAQVASVSRSGQNAIVTLKSGEQVTVGNFFSASAEGVRSDMVFQGEDGVLWQAQYSAEAFNGFSFTQLSALDDLLVGAGVVGSATPEWAIAGLGALGAGGAGAAAASGLAGGGGGGGGGGTATTPADTTAPDAPSSLLLGSDGLALTGLGEAGATVNAFDAFGGVLATGTVGADGRFALTLSRAQLNGERLSVTQTDTAGNASPAAGLVAADVTAPAAPTGLVIDASARVLSGQGEAGATVTVRNAGGALLGTAVVAADGQFTVGLSSAQLNGETLAVVQADAAGNASPAASLIAADVTAPTAPINLALDATGGVLSGNAEAGATVTVRDANGTVLGTGLAAADGTFSLSLIIVPGPGASLAVNATDAAGNASPDASLTLPLAPLGPDVTPPALATDVAISGDGILLSGRGEPGALATLLDAVGNVLITGQVAADGSFDLPVIPGVISGQVLQLTLTDAAGNVSANLPIQAPDLSQPSAPTNLVFSADGLSLSGFARPGARILMRNAVGRVVGAGRAGADGGFTLALDVAYLDGQVFDVTATLGNGNSSLQALVSAPDVTLPSALTDLVISSDGLALSGQGEAGASVTVVNNAGAVIGTGSVAANGTFVAALAPAVAVGASVVARQADAAGNLSVDTSVSVPAAVPAAPASLALTTDGLNLTGTATVGATVEVRSADGTLLGSVTVAADGTFSVPLSNAQLNGQLLDVTVLGSAGGTSVTALVTAADVVAPDAATELAINPNGALLSGRGEAGATVTVRDPTGAVVGTGTVGATGSFALLLTPAQLNGQVLQVSLTDSAGNTAAAGISAPDLDGPLVPQNLALDASGSLLNGLGEVGATVTVRDAAGVVLGTTVVDADSRFSVALATAQANGQALQVSAVSATGLASPLVPFIAPDVQAPAPVGNLAIIGQGLVLTGTGEAGATVRVLDPSGATLGTGVVAGDGSFSVNLSAPQARAEALEVQASDAAGNQSAPVAFTAPDLTPPALPGDLSISANGRIVSGSGEPGASVTVSNAAGAPLGTGTVGANGRFDVTLTEAQVNGQALGVSQADAAGNSTTAAPLTAPDIQAPAAPTALAVVDNGNTLTGVGEPLAQLTVRSLDGKLLGSSAVNADGSFSVVLDTPQVNGQALQVVQADARGNLSPLASVSAPDTSAPATVGGLVLSGNGAILTGTGEPGATVTVRDGGGTALGSAPVDVNGNFSVALTPPQLNGQTLNVEQADPSGNLSVAQPLATRDLTAPAAPAVLGLSADGLSVTGSAEANSRVEVRNLNGDLLGSGITSPTGSFSVTLDTPQLNGQGLQLTATDTAGNLSQTLITSALDTTPPPGVTDLVISPDGAALSGRGEAGALVTVTNAANLVLGTTRVGPDGVFTLVLTPPAATGDLLSVVETDAAGNAAPPTSLTGPDGTQVATPGNLALSSDGYTLTGTGLAGNTVNVTDASGTTLGTALVGSDGTFRTLLRFAQLNGQLLHVSAADAAGQSSMATTLLASDVTAPDTPLSLAVINGGGLVTGRGEPGASVTVSDANATVLGTAIVGSNGSFTLPLSPAQLNGQALTAVQTDAAGNVSQVTAFTAPDLQGPAAPTGLVINTYGTVVNGLGEAGATATVRNAAGTVLATAVVNQSGAFQVVLPIAQDTGAALSVQLTDAAGNGSPSATVGTPDFTPPAPVTGLLISADGSSLSGLGEPGARVNVLDAAGTLLGTAVVDPNGVFAVALTPPPTNGETLGVIQADASGNPSAAVNFAAPDISPPAVLSAVVINADGVTVTGQGEPGATVFVRGLDGSVLGTGLVASNGAFSVTLTSPQLNAQPLTINQEDPPGNEGPAINLLAPDIQAPASPSDLVINASGLQVVGRAEAGALVTLRDAQGTVLGSTVASAAGSFVATLNAPQLNGQLLNVTASDAAGNLSAPAILAAADLTPPAEVSSLAVSADGSTLTGLGEAGSIINARAADGTLLGTTTVGSDGRFSLALVPAPAAGDALAVIASDTAGNATAAALVTAPGALASSAASNLLLSSDGLNVTGLADAGNLVRVYNAIGQLLGTALVGSDGTFSAPLLAAQLNGQALTVIATSTDGIVAPAAALLAPDVTAPLPVTTFSLASDGARLTGFGEAGSTLWVLAQGGLILATTTVGADGAFAVTLVPAQLAGQSLGLTLVDAAGNESLVTTLTAPDLTAPNPASSLSLSPDGGVLTGNGEAGATVAVHNATGTLLGTGTVRLDGTFEVAITPAQANGQTLAVTLVDTAGNTSLPAAVVALDTTAPGALTALAIGADGASITGRGEPGARVTISDADGNPLGTATVSSTGTFAVVLATPLLNAETLTLTQRDDAGNVSPSATLITPDLTPPAPLSNVVINGAGAVVSGNGEAGATVTVRDGAGTLLATTLVLADGSFRVALTTPQINQQVLSVQQADPPGNVSPPFTLLAPDLTPPALPGNLAINAAGDQLSGTGEPLAQVRVTLADGSLVGTGNVNANGIFQITFTSPVNNGQALLVTLTDSAGNASPIGTLGAPDTTAPAQVTGLTLDSAGSVLSGAGEAGASLVVTNTNGDTLAFGTVANDGSFALALSTPQLNGQVLQVVQQDAAGNPSAVSQLTALDLTPPAAPTVTALTSDGLTLTGTGEANARVRVLSASGATLGGGIVNADGTWTLSLSSVQLNGQALTITQADTAGNTSAAVPFLAPDTTAPSLVSNLALSTDGLNLTGTAEAGALVTVTGINGLALGTVRAAADGTFSLALASAQLNGQTLNVVQTDLANNTSGSASLQAADVTSPVTPTVTSLTNAGLLLSGTAEALSTVTVTAADGSVLGSGQAGADGLYAITLNAAQANGQALSLVAQDRDGNLSAVLPYTAPDTTAPAAVTALAVSSDYTTLAGRGEPGALVTVTLGAQTLGTATVGADGSFVITLTGAIAANDTLSVRQADVAGNASAAQTLTVPQVPPPLAPTALVLSGDGLTLSGNATAGSTVRVYGTGGSLLGSATAAADGTFSVALSSAQTNGQVLDATATTQPGGESVPAALTAPDTTGPVALTEVTINGTGTLVTARGEVGAIVTLRALDGSVLSTAVVGPSGSVTLALAPPQANGQGLTISQADAAGNASAAQSLIAPDITPPAAPTQLALNAAGVTLTGRGEAGATAQVRDLAGNLLGSAIVAGDGSFSVTLNSAQLNGQALSVTLTDPANNVSAPANLGAVDTTPPAILSNLQLSGSGLQVSGTGEAGATITITNAAGAVLGTAVVGPTGSFTVQLSAAQLNGQVLAVRETDAAGNALTGSLTAPDVTAPAAPLSVAVAPDGRALTGTGEVGSRASVYDANGTLLGSATVGATGAFTVALSPAQADGQALTVRLTDAAGNGSSLASITAPDITPPAAPATAVVSPSGTLVSGTGIAGARIFVRNALGVLLGTATVAANGTWAATLSPAQVDNQVLSVVQADAAGNLSTALSVTAPDLTPPPAATALVVAADGNSLSGTGEAGATVTVRSASGAVLGTGIVAANGTFTLALSSPQINGEALSVGLADARGNQSIISSVIAPDIDVNRPVIASDDLTTASVALAPVLTTRNYADSFTTALTGFSKAFTFTVASGTTADPLLTLTTGSALALYNGATYTLQVQDASGNWVTLGTAQNGSLVNVSLLAGRGVQVDIGALLAGNYRLVVASNGIGVLTNVTSNLQLDITSLTQFSGTAGALLNGNVITDVGVDGTTDITGPDNGAVVQVLRNGGFVNTAGGVTVQGQYGLLTIDARGNYTYAANGSTASVGKVDVFTYQLTHPNGLSDTANLYVRIDSPQATEVWNSGNLAAPATVVDATFDIASSALSLTNKVTSTTSPLGSVSVLLGGGSGTFSFSVAAGTLSDLTLTLSATNLASVLGSVTLGLYKLNPANGQYVLVGTWGASGLVGVGGGAVGVTVDDQTAGTYQVRLSVGGVGVLSTVNVGLVNVATYNNQFTVSNYTPVTGNLLTDTAGGGADVLGSAYTWLSVLTAGNYVIPGYNGTAIAGTYGTLLVKADGSYTYTLNSGLTDAAIGRQDVFTYSLTHPNGTADSATLTVNLNAAGATVTSASLATLSSTSLAEDHSTALAASDALTIRGTDGNDTLDGSHGGAITLIGGAGDDTLIIVDQQFASVDGGSGTDTLVWAGGAANIDLGNLHERIHNIEAIDLNTTAPVSLTLGLSDLLSVLSPDTTTLLIKGTAQDSLHVTGHWQADGTQHSAGVDYLQYTPQEDPTHHLWVQSGIQMV